MISYGNITLGFHIEGGLFICTGTGSVCFEVNDYKLQLIDVILFLVNVLHVYELHLINIL